MSVKPEQSSASEEDENEWFSIDTEEQRLRDDMTSKQSIGASVMNDRSEINGGTPADEGDEMVELSVIKDHGGSLSPANSKIIDVIQNKTDVGVDDGKDIDETQAKQNSHMKEYEGQWYTLKELKSSLNVPDIKSVANTELNNRSEADNIKPIYIGSIEDISSLERKKESEFEDIRAEHTGALLNAFTSNETGQTRWDEGSFAAIERPEPLGKAWVDNNLVVVSKSGSKLSQILVKESDVEKPSPIANGDDLIESSDDGLKEQEYPMRLPLSVLEGYNKVNTSKAPRSIESSSNQAAGRPTIEREAGKKNILMERGTVSVHQHAVEDTNVISPFIKTNHGIDSKDEANDKQRLLNNDKKESDLHNPVDTQISAMLEPTYQSSVALLKELRKRRLRPENDFVVGNENRQSQPIDPLHLAENAVKASNILSSRTAKSLKRASLVLRAVEEHRTPPSDLYESSYSNLSGPLSDLSIGIPSSSMPDISIRSGDESKSSKDTIDRLIDVRLKGQNDQGLFVASSFSDDSAPSSSLLTKSASKNSLSQSSSIRCLQNSNVSDFVSSYASHPVESIVENDVSQEVPTSKVTGIHLPSASLQGTSSDATSSQLMMLESMEKTFDSPVTQGIAVKFQTQLDEISPIEKQREHQASEGAKFRASSRIRRDASMSSKRDSNLSDSEIVKLHRSLGAGTITPLPWSTVPPCHQKDGINDSAVSKGSSTVDLTATDDEDEGLHSNSMLSSEHKSQNSTSDNSASSKTISSVKDTLLKDKDENAEKYHSARSLVTAKASNIRGIYDIRDSTGPGSRNRRRRISGKQPVWSTNPKRDQGTVYVSGDSKSELSVISSELKERKATDREENGSQEINSIKDERMNATSESYSSMLSDFPVMSFISHNPSRDISRYAASPKQHASLHVSKHSLSSESNSHLKTPLDSRKKGGKESSEGGKDSTLTEGQSSSSQIEQSFVRSHERQSKSENSFDIRKAGSVSPITREYPISGKRQLNQLWERFTRNFDGANESRKGDMLKKIDVLNEMLVDQGVRQPSNASLRKTDSQKNKVMDQQRRNASTDPVSSVASEGRAIAAAKTQQKGSCPVCGDQNDVVNKDSSAPLRKRSKDKNDAPLLLHIWTQTTPNSKQFGSTDASLQMSPNQQKEPKIGTGKKNSKKLTGHPPVEKENISPDTRKSNVKNVRLADPGPFSWNVIIDDKPKKSDEKKCIRKEILQNSTVSKKKKEPVFTAWFQSTRSDTSSGTVVPLSSVPKLAETYKEGKRVPKIILEDTKPKETASVVRVGLQEAFRFAKSDFIQRSRVRMEHVKNARNRVIKKKNINNLQEHRVEEAFLKSSAKQIYPPAVERLFKPKKRVISKKEMLDQNKKMYDKLPEVIQRREEEQRKARYQKNRILMKQFDKKLRTKLLRHQKC